MRKNRFLLARPSPAEQPLLITQYKTRLESLQLNGTAVPPGEARESASVEYSPEGLALRAR